VKRSATVCALAVIALGVLTLAGGDAVIASGGHPPDRTTASGLVFHHYADAGWQLQPLLSFAHLNSLVTAGDEQAAGRLVDALLARGRPDRGALYWEYNFPYQGASPPWRSGFVQAIAAEALARASELLGRPSLLRPAGAALRGLRHLLLRVDGGLWIQEYGFTQEVILNSQLQSLLSLESYARLVGTPAARSLVQSLYRATVRLLPRFDLGCHSLYELRGPAADSHYQAYHVLLLRRLANRHPTEPVFRRLWAS
jgi:hypothetical protein